jgi:hypothetical protein
MLNYQDCVNVAISFLADANIVLSCLRSTQEGSLAVVL